MMGTGLVLARFSALEGLELLSGAALVVVVAASGLLVWAGVHYEDRLDLVHHGHGVVHPGVVRYVGLVAVIATDMPFAVPALRQLLAVTPADDIVETVVARRTVTVGEKMQWIQRLLAEQSSVPFHRVVGRGATRVDIVVSLWAVLEMIKRGSLQARQPELFGDILLFQREEQPAAA